MKVWVKLLIGSVLGIILGIFLPRDFAAGRIAETAYKIALNIGRWTAMPLLFFGLTISIYELRTSRRFWPLVGRTIFVMVLMTVLVIVLGIAVTFIFPPERVPIIMEEQAIPPGLEPEQFFLNLIPSNMFLAFTGDGSFVFPLFLCAFFLAMGLTYDIHYTKLVITFIDSLSRIFFHIAAFFSEILGVIIIAVSAYWTIQYRSAITQESFKAIILLLLIFSLILGLLILPVLLYLLRKRPNPWAALYGTLAPAIASFFSGDMTFSLPVLLHISKANLGIKRPCSQVTLTLWSTFGRSGSAMVASIALIVIVKSYSILGIEAKDILTIILNALSLTFLLGRHSGGAAFVCLASLCAAYGNGFENSFLILKPMAFFLIALGAFLDVMIAALGSLMVAILSGFHEDKAVRHFV